MVGYSLQDSMEAQMALMNGDFEKVKNILEGSSRSKDQAVLLQAYLFNADFEECYSLATAMIASNIQEQYANNAYDVLSIFKHINFDYVPQISNHSSKQSKENSFEQYPDLDEFYSVFDYRQRDKIIEERKSKGKFRSFFKSNAMTRFEGKIANQIDSNDIETRAHAWFMQAEIHLYYKEFEDALQCYHNAIKENPNKALYYGYYAQLLNQLNSTPILASTLTNRAIELDPLNARWYWLKGHASLALIEESGNEIYLKTAINYWRKAYTLCKPDQTQFLDAMDYLFCSLNIDEYIKNPPINN